MFHNTTEHHTRAIQMNKSYRRFRALLSVALISGAMSWSAMIVPAEAAMVSSVSELALSGGLFQEPSGVLQQDSINNLLTGLAPADGRGVTSARNNAQSFIVSATDFPLGVELTGFVIHVGGGSVTPGTFGVALFPVSDPQAGTLTASGPALVSNSSTSLTLAANTAPRTAVFEFDTAVTLLPGAYAWQFLPASDAGFSWERRTTNLYPPGFRYEAGTGSGNADFQFGVVGTAVVPEPSGVTLIGVALTGLGMLRRKVRRSA
jgi:hypothetical protein